MLLLEYLGDSGNQKEKKEKEREKYKEVKIQRNFIWGSVGASSSG